MIPERGINMSLHLGASEGAVADNVLLPGDPLRAKYIAETYLQDPVCYNSIRGMLGFTGTYQGKRVSVQGTGMGMPSISIYVNELLQSYKVRRLIRVGTCGSMNPLLRLKDLLLASASTTDSAMNHERFGSMSYAPVPDFGLLLAAYQKAVEMKLSFQVGQVFTSDQFYDDRLEEKTKLLARYGVLACDMETSELYTLAAKYNAKALTIMTVSDSLVTGESVPPLDRQTTFNDMMELALGVIIQA